MTLVLGIDGGGSSLRAALVRFDGDNVSVIAEAARGTANPSVIGREASAALIQGVIRELCAVEPPAAVGIGLAGASPVHSDVWLRQVVNEVLPDVHVAAALDVEIALVGAHGRRYGALVLAGTGSIAFGIDAAGRSVQVGGWGYVIGDEGAGSWIGRAALTALAHWSDGMNPDAGDLARRVMEHLQIDNPVDVIAWTYRQPIPVREIAALTGIVFEAAETGDVTAGRIVSNAAQSLADLTRALRRRLNDPAAPLAFAGGLLTSDTPVRRELCALLGLNQPPVPVYSPVIGAALLARLQHSP